MRNLIIIGAGGMGRHLFCMAEECNGYKQEFVIKGFIDDNQNALDGFDGYPSVISKVSDYKVQENDCFICSIGNVHANKLSCEKILKQSGIFITLIHPKAFIRRNVVIGQGTIIGAAALIDCDVIIGEHCLIQSFAVIGHDVKIGDWTRVDTHVTCVGGVEIGSNVMIHTSAILNHKVIVGDNAIIGAGSFVVRRVKSGCTVFGNPAKKLL